MEDKEKFLMNVDHRLNRIFGQIKAIQKSIHSSEDTSCKDVVYQIKATRSALKKISNILIDRKIHMCIDPNKKEFIHLKESLELLSKEY